MPQIKKFIAAVTEIWGWMDTQMAGQTNYQLLDSPLVTRQVVNNKKVENYIVIRISHTYFFIVLKYWTQLPN